MQTCRTKRLTQNEDDWEQLLLTAMFENVCRVYEIPDCVECPMTVRSWRENDHVILSLHSRQPAKCYNAFGGNTNSLLGSGTSSFIF